MILLLPLSALTVGLCASIMLQDLTGKSDSGYRRIIDASPQENPQPSGMVNDMPSRVWGSKRSFKIACAECLLAKLADGCRNFWGRASMILLYPLCDLPVRSNSRDCSTKSHSQGRQ